MLANRRRRRKIVSYVSIIAGMILLFLGGRDVVESRVGQKEAQRAFEKIDVARPSPFPERHKSKPVVPPVPVGETFAKLVIPRLHAELYVVEGDGASQLRRGPGHVAGTVMPGQEGNCIIAGHRDTHFRLLKDIRKGDEIVLETQAGQYTYRVGDTQVVSPSDTAPLEPTRNAQLHLITCYPFYYLGSAPKRFVVEAQLEEGASHPTVASSAGVRSAY
jgi:sortase A